ncbi:YifB family Mg chelatase-like AAA ATPase [Acetivibrio mesophilus]|uniref:ATP-binding protein n=1 Tax=Acetivibrio mesophilus TaxID=2487273 RepID=A0A4Q0I8K7_9FIRM|nr:YifB family Mg chelatase-like AAA ATPase [Acetivibrio mesophilus]RXE60275.1 ATP-binding protein [Acetivibrio mesophilus]HHV29854.1 YifB family Mg chelatase-like AAA ATPase [Clostridium sp.]
MLSKIKSMGLMGMDGYVVIVETDISNGIPSFDMVGLGDTAVKESKERVRAAIKNAGLEFPIKRITVNLAPADKRKEGSAFDLPIALGILTATEQIRDNNLDRYAFLGELSLDGGIKPVKGILPMVLCARDNGVDNIILPLENADEAAVVKDINVLPAKNIIDVVNHLNGASEIGRHEVDVESFFNRSFDYDVDFADVKGQETVKRALEVAASGGHNCLMIGSPGCGKTMIAKRLPTILPFMTFEEALEVTKIHSIAGNLPANTSLITQRPFRAPHHSISNVSLIGGGKIPKPGEISLAHYGVLFLDELPEFNKDALEVLRQPLEDGVVTISRINATLTYPARTTLICAANPCKCGNYLEDAKECTCTPKQIQQYLGKISGPLLDRIDLHIEVASVKYKDLESQEEGEKSSVIRERVNRTRKIQQERYKGLGIFSNAELSPSMIKKFCKLDDNCKGILRNAFDKLGLSARAHNRILKVARTIADMQESENIKANHLLEAIQYRSLDRKKWSEPC